MTNSRDTITRRDFVAATTLGAAVLWRGAPVHVETPADEALLYVGTYTDRGRRDGIYLLRMDTGTGALRQVGATDAGSNPSYLALHPTGRVLYAVNEVTEMAGKQTGSLRAFAVDSGTGALTLLNEQPTGGGAPCYVSTDRSGSYAMAANYVGGSVVVFPIERYGELAPSSHIVQHMGKGLNRAQEKAHAHSIMAHPNNRFVLVADLGVDRVFVYRFDEARGTLAHVESSDAELSPGTGPRHFVFHPRLPLVFVAGELNSSVTTFRCDPSTGALTAVQTLPTLPALWNGANSVADIHVSADGRALYVSNRGHNSIAVFSISESGTLAPQQVMSTGGDWPRNFTLDPTGRWLLVANQRSGSIIVFARNAESGRLTSTTQRIEVPSPVCLLFA